MNKSDLSDVVVEALTHYGGKASIIDVCKFTWIRYEKELRSSVDLFYTWQYDIRRAATDLRKERIMFSAKESSLGIWELKEKE